MNEQTGVIGSVGGDLSLQAGGDIVAGDKTIINNIVQRIAKELTPLLTSSSRPTTSPTAISSTGAMR